MSQSSPFDFKPSGKTEATAPNRPASAAKQSPLIQLIVIGAWICLVYAPLSPNWFAPFTIGNTLLNLISVVPFALIPLAVLWRIRNEEPLSPTQQYIGCAAVGLAVILTLAIWFGTGFLGSANWHTWWCSFLGRCAVAAVILWFPQFSTKTPLPLVVVGAFALLMIVSFLMRGWALTMPNVIWSGYAGFKTVLILISLLEKLVITSVVAGFIASRWEPSSVSGKS